MPQKVYTVVIDGEEFVSKAAQEAGEGMDKFTGKKDKWIKSFVDLKAAWDAIAAAATRVWGAVQASFDAFDAYEASLRKMGAQSKITGIPIEELTNLAKKGREEFGLGSVTANDFATAVGKYASRAGDASQSTKLMAAALDLGAASGLSAAATMEALEQGLRGQDEGFDKLLGKNPSALWKEYADANGLAVGKMTDTQKRMAELTAIVDAGGKVTGEYAERLTTAAGKQDLLNNRMENAKVKVGEALVPLREMAYVVMGDLANSTGGAVGSISGMSQSLASLVNALRPVFGWIVKVVDVLAYSFSSIIQFLAIDIQRFALQSTVSFGKMAEGIGSFVQKSGDVLRVFGVKVVAETGSQIREWGETTRQVAENSLLGLTLKFNQYKDWVQTEGDRVYKGIAVAAKRDLGSAGDETEKLGGTASSELGTTVPAAAAKAGAAIRKQMGATVQDLLGVTEQAMKDLGKTAAMTLAPKQAHDFSGALTVLKRKVDEAKAALQDLPAPIEQSERKTGDLAREVGTVARGALDLAQSFGVVDAQAAALLNSVVNIASALPKALAGDLTSIAGIIGGVANIASQIMGGDKARNKLLSDNTRSLGRLTSEVGNLRLGVTGDTFTKVGAALGAIVPNLKRDNIENKAFNLGTILQGLQAQGLSLADLEEVGKALGVNIKDSKGQLSIGAFKQLLEAIGLTEFGQFGSGFTDKLDSTTRGFDINNVGAVDQIRQLFGVGAGFSPALQGVFDANDLGGTRGRLAGLFAQLQAGTLDASQFGGLTGTQFLDLITDLIGRIDGLPGNTPGAPPAPPSLGDEGLPPAGGPVTPVLTLADVFRDYGAASVPLFQSQLEAQLRIASATEATADNTAMTVDELRGLRELMASGAFVDTLDRALADRRRQSETDAGQGATP